MLCTVLFTEFHLLFLTIFVGLTFYLTIICLKVFSGRKFQTFLSKFTIFVQHLLIFVFLNYVVNCTEVNTTKPEKWVSED